MLILLGILAAVAVMGSDAPSPIAVPFALLAALAGPAHAWAEARRPVVALYLPGGNGRPSVDGQPVRDVRVSRRGPVTLVGWRDTRGRWTFRSFWPDTLSRAARRELTLAAGDWRVSPERRSMAP